MAAKRPLDAAGELVEAFDHAARVSEYLVGALPRRLWRADPPGGGRTIAGTVAHMQSLRRTFAKMAGADPGPALDRAASTQAEARRALGRSRAALTGLFREALARGDGRIKGLPRRTVNMMLYLAQHEAHHRGQICSLARQLGHALRPEDVTRIWGWRKLP